MNVGLQVKRTAEAKMFAQKLAGMQKDNGSLDSARTSITCSGGVSLTLEVRFSVQFTACHHHLHDVLYTHCRRLVSLCWRG